MQRIAGVAIVIIIGVCAVMFRGESAAKVEQRVDATSAKLQEIIRGSQDYDKHAEFLADTRSPPTSTR